MALYFLRDESPCWCYNRESIAGDVPKTIPARIAGKSALAETAQFFPSRMITPPRQGKTPIRPNILKRMLNEAGYDFAKTQFCDGFSQGVRLNCSCSPSTTCMLSHNLQSAQQHPGVVAQKLTKELDAERIYYLLYPEGKSVNDGISDFDSSVSYTKLSDAIAHIRSYGSRCFLAKSDIESAFRLLPVHPDDHHLLGMIWQGHYYNDLCLPMGCASSCNLFEEFSTALEHSIHYHTKSVILHVLDDFLFIEWTEHKCKLALEIFMEIAESIGAPIASDKTEGPATILSF